MLLCKNMDNIEIENGQIRESIQRILHFNSIRKFHREKYEAESNFLCAIDKQSLNISFETQRNSYHLNAMRIVKLIQKEVVDIETINFDIEKEGLSCGFARNRDKKKMVKTAVNYHQFHRNHCDS